MILELYMKNCALVEESRVNLGENLNILTGETGSGKSIMIEALGLCLGNKYDKSFLRKGTEKGRKGSQKSRRSCSGGAGGNRKAQQGRSVHCSDSGGDVFGNRNFRH